jgi:hypothetical protein
MTEDQTYPDRLAIFDAVVARIPDIKRKGRTMPYTSVNGHMFALLNKKAELGFRLGKEGMAAFFAAHDSGPHRSHGAELRGYVRLPDAMMGDLDQLEFYLRQAKTYVETLPPK